MMQIFGYCSQGEEDFSHSDEWLQEQQSLFNFANYPELTEDFERYKKLNEIAMGSLGGEPKTYALNLDKKNQICGRPSYPDVVMQVSMKGSFAKNE